MINLITRHFKAVVIVFLLSAVIIGLFGFRRISINSDLTNLADKFNEAYKEQIDFLAEKLSSNTLIVLAYTDGNIGKTKRAIELLKERFEESGYIAATLEMDNPELFVKYGFLGFDTEMFQQVGGLQDLGRGGFLDFAYWRKTFTILSMLSDFAEAYTSRKGIERYVLVSPDQKIMLINFTLNQNLSDVGSISRAVGELRSIAKQVTKATGTKFAFTGTPAGVYESNKQVQKDFTITSMVSLAGITLLIYLGYGSWGVLLCLFVSMIIGMCLTLGLVGLVVGEINIVTSFVNAMVLGLGIDYGIHMMSRMAEYAKKLEIEQSVREAFSEIARPSLAALLTTIGAFGSLYFGLSRPFVQMATFSILGMICFYLTMMFFLPSLVLVFRVRPSEKDKLGFLKEMFLTVRSRKFAIVVSIIFVCLILLGVLNLREYWYTPPGLVSRNAESAIAFAELKRSFQRVGFGEVCVVAEDFEELKRIDELLRKSDLFIPPLSVLSLMEFSNFNSNRRTFDLYASLSETVNNPFLVALFKRIEMYPQILDMLRLLKSSKDLNDILNELKKDVPLFFYERNGRTMYVLYTDTVKDLYKGNHLKTVHNFLVANDVKFFGTPAMLYMIMEDMKKSMYKLTFLTICGVFVMLLLSIKSLKGSLLISMGVLSSIVITFGVGIIFGIHATFMTLLSLPLLLGLGVDGLIHMRHAILRQDESHTYRTFKSVFLSSVTTIVAFGSFSVAQGELLREFGILMSIGFVVCFLVTALLSFHVFGGEVHEDSNVH
ncbi:RND transporter [Thermotoga sp. Ku-13t]|uniref:efflux RND transporter permease subunit n=1 Tax=Thermotoga sp. Ku-13t TaxID=1755813 RepID=UPI0013EAC2D1|nr:MMPL family transporter [Thermotoga sp. Ku-13t]KAF2957484.1 RND transporter [Thermotoga sp. Ku-13t]